MTHSSTPSGAVPSSRPALARCLAMAPEEFAATAWAQGPVLSAAVELPQDFSDLFGADAVDELVSRRGLRTPFLRLATQGSVLAPARFTRSGGLGATIADQVADDLVLAEFNQGATLVLQGLHRTWPPLIDFAQQLSADLGHPVQINAYVTPASNRGFDAHYDVHDVLVLQVAGDKRWRIHRPVHEAPLADQPWTDRRAAVAERAREDPVIDAVLRPGDALYLPRGWLHAADALGQTTIHLTVGIHATTRYDLLQALLAEAADTPELRASLPMGLDPDDELAIAADLEATVKAAAERLAAARPADAARTVRRRLERTTRPEPIGPLAQVDAAAALTPATLIRLRRHCLARIEDAAADADGQARIAVVSAGRRITLPASAHRAVEALLAGAPQAVGDLPGLEESAALSLAARLLREGVVVPA